MITKMPSEKAVRKALVKKGHGKLLEKFDSYKMKLADAVSKGIVTEADLDQRLAPAEYLDLLDKHDKSLAILKRHANVAFDEISEFSENPDDEVASFERDDEPVYERQAKERPSVEQLTQAYLKNPSRENAAAMVKEKLLGKRNVEDRYRLAEEVAARNTSEMVNRIRQDQVKQQVIDERKSRSDAATMSAQEANDKAVRDFIASDKRLERKAHEPGNKYLGDRKQLVEDQLKANEAAMETLY